MRFSTKTGSSDKMDLTELLPKAASNYNHAVIWDTSKFYQHLPFPAFFKAIESLCVSTASGAQFKNERLNCVYRSWSQQVIGAVLLLCGTLNLDFFVIRGQGL